MVSAKKLRRDPSGWDGGVKPADAPERATVATRPAKKDTRRWCKGKVGREHRVEIVMHHYYASPLFGECRYTKWRWWNEQEAQERWSCHHAERCAACGKYLRTQLNQAECPTWVALGLEF